MKRKQKLRGIEIDDALALGRLDTAALENEKRKTLLLEAIQDRLNEYGNSQTEIAAALGIDRARVSDLLRGRIQRFSLEWLLVAAAKLGLSVTMKIRKSAA